MTTQTIRPGLRLTRRGAIGALASYPATVRRVLELPGDEHIVCGLALGRPDPQAPVNQARTTRAALAEYHREIE